MQLHSPSSVDFSNSGVKEQERWSKGTGDWRKIWKKLKRKINERREELRIENYKSKNMQSEHYKGIDMESHQ